MSNPSAQTQSDSA